MTYLSFTNTLPSNFPQKPVTRSPVLMSFPEDLIQDNRNFHIQIQFVNYRSVLYGMDGFFQGPSIVGNIFSPQKKADVIEPSKSGGIALPIPRKIDDQNTVQWGKTSLSQTGAQMLFGSKGPSGILKTASVATGLAMNPYLFMKFESPEFKEFTFNWTFAPSNENESNILKNIIDIFKYEMLPQKAFGVMLDYPSIALMKFYPEKKFLFTIKPCAVSAVGVDYTAAGGPSFFKNGAPTVVNLSVRFKEIEYWTKNDYVR